MLKISTKLTLTILCSLFVACAQKQTTREPVTIPDASSIVPAPTLTPETQAQFDAARSMLRSGELKGAKALFESLETQFPTLAGIKTNLGIIAMQQGLYEKALNKAREATELNPRNAEAYLIEGQALIELKDYHLAETAYSKAVKLEPNNPYAHYGMGVMYDLYIQDWDKAEEHYESYLKLADQQQDKQTITQVENWLKLLERKR